jgi:hypothetical protein
VGAEVRELAVDLGLAGGVHEGGHALAPLERLHQHGGVHQRVHGDREADVLPPPEVVDEAAQLGGLAGKVHLQATRNSHQPGKGRLRISTTSRSREGRNLCNIRPLRWAGNECLHQTSELKNLLTPLLFNPKGLKKLRSSSWTSPKVHDERSW